MKRLLPLLLITLTLPSCDHLGPLTRLGIDYGEKRKILASDDAAALHAAQAILLPPVTIQP